MKSYFSEEFYRTGFNNEDSELLNQSFTSVNRVKFDLFKRYGWIAAAGDRHLAEFMPGGEYLKDPETVLGWGFYLTTVDWRKEDLKRRLEKSAKLVSGEINRNRAQHQQKTVITEPATAGTRILSGHCCFVY